MRVASKLAGTAGKLKRAGVRHSDRRTQSRKLRIESKGKKLLFTQESVAQITATLRLIAQPWCLNLFLRVCMHVEGSQWL